MTLYDTVKNLLEDGTRIEINTDFPPNYISVRLHNKMCVWRSDLIDEQELIEQIKLMSQDEEE